MKKALGILALFIIIIIGFSLYRNAVAPSSYAPVERIEAADFYRIRSAVPSRTPLAVDADIEARKQIDAELTNRIADFKVTAQQYLNPDEMTRLREQGRTYELVLDYKQYLSAEHVSYVYMGYEDTGGAHPNAYFFVFVFNRAGERVSAESLFVGNESWLENISQVATNQVTAQVRLRAAQNGVTEGDPADGIFTEGLEPRIENFSLFYLDGEDIVFIIQPYQAGPWAFGSFEVRVPLAQLLR